MPASAACRDLYRPERFESLFRNVHLIEIDFAAVERNSALHGIANGTRLLKYLFEHEMFEPAFFGHYRVPRDSLSGRLDDAPVKISHAYRVFCDDSYLAVT